MTKKKKKEKEKEEKKSSQGLKIKMAPFSWGMVKHCLGKYIFIVW